MKFEPIIKAKIDKFKTDYGIQGSDDSIFEKYVNYQILEMLYPGINDTDSDLLEQVCVGGTGDIGLDGIIFLVNGSPIRSIDDVKDFLKIQRKVDFQFIFIQSKNKNGFKHNEFEVFLTGVEDFLREKITLPGNEKVMYWHEVYAYICSPEAIIKQSKKPEISIYYVTTGKWEEQEYIVSDFNSFSEHLSSKNSFSKPQSYYIDSRKFMSIVNSNDNYYETSVNYIEYMDLPEAAGAKKSTVVLCPAEEIVKLITTDDGILRRNIFDDNVRDFQGYTDINLEIKETIRNNPEQFLLLNNGITVVCSDIDVGNRRVKINSPQIVNGCQTCNVLFECSRDGINLADVRAVVKFISSDDSNIINNIVRGTNRQNIVYEEAFEITREFHKSLEKFFLSYSVESFPKIYYERRSKQYEKDATIKPSQKVNFRIIIQSMVGLFLGRLDESYKHESRLLKDYSSILFVENQTFLPYYTASFFFKQVDNLYRQGILPKNQRAFQMHVTYVLMLMLNKQPSDINNIKRSDQYCKELFAKINTLDIFINEAKNASKRFDDIVDEWVREKGESYRSGIKDNSEFTRFLRSSFLIDRNDIGKDNYGKGITYRHAECNDRGVQSEDNTKIKNRGVVVHVGNDVYGTIYGFISRKPNNIFFHSSDNPNIKTWSVGMEVLYDITGKGESQKAVGIKTIASPNESATM